ncbi:MAG: Flp1 family type IVb pilin [Faecalimonas sp.]|nr:Flp1 family type IVb pilin [Faecalimonas sp.]
MRQYLERCWKKVKKEKVSGSVMVEAILVLVVLIALVVIFKTQLTSLVTTIFEKITNEATGI